MIRYVIDAVRGAGVERILVVVGYRAELVRRELADEPGLEFAEQTEQLGTGHAVMMCRERLDVHEGPVLILAGDSPMVQASSLQIAARRVRRPPPPACWAPARRTTRPAWAASSATRTASSSASSKRRTPRPSSGRSPKST